jgi:hypothetical protein
VSRITPSEACADAVGVSMPPQLRESGPNFLIIGAPKAATTFLYDCLGQHPQVFLTRKKETRFFAFEGASIHRRDPVNQSVITDIRDYAAAFEGASGYGARGEVSPVYLASEHAPERIHRRFPSMKFIAVVRQPVERAYSHFMFARQKGFEPRDATFHEALTVPAVTVRGFRRQRPYIVDSLYGQALRRYLRFFDKGQFLFLRHEDLRNERTDALRRVERFLNVNHFGRYEFSDSLAASGEPNSWWLYRLVASRPAGAALKAVFGRRVGSVKHSEIKARFLSKELLTESDWQLGMDLFLDDIHDFESLTGLDLADWRRSVSVIHRA